MHKVEMWRRALPRSSGGGFFFGTASIIDICAPLLSRRRRSLSQKQRSGYTDALAVATFILYKTLADDKSLSHPLSVASVAKVILILNSAHFLLHPAMASIPEELLTRIIQLISAEPDGPLRTKALCTCAAATRILRDEAQRNLFNRVTIQSAAQGAAFRVALLTETNVGEYVTSFTANDDIFAKAGYNLYDFLALMPRLVRLRVYASNIPTSAPHSAILIPTNLKVIDVVGHMDGRSTNRGNIIDFISRIPSLHQLYVHEDPTFPFHDFPSAIFVVPPTSPRTALALEFGPPFITLDHVSATVEEVQLIGRVIRRSWDYGDGADVAEVV
jgi:hypothetical protein